MAYAWNFIKLTWGGSLANDEEIWTCGMHFANQNADVIGGAWTSIDETVMTNIADAIRTMHTTSGLAIPQGVRLEWVKVALIGRDGKYEQAPKEFILSTPAGGATSASYAPQLSTVITLQSDKYKDPGKFNRYYVPSLGPVGAPNYKYTSAMTAEMAETHATMIDSLNNIFNSLSGQMGLRAAAVNQQTSTYEYITKVKVGSIVDTQRRRRNKLVEEYSEFPVSNI